MLGNFIEIFHEIFEEQGDLTIVIPYDIGALCKILRDRKRQDVIYCLEFTLCRLLLHLIEDPKSLFREGL